MAKKSTRKTSVAGSKQGQSAAKRTAKKGRKTKGASRTTDLSATELPPRTAPTPRTTQYLVTMDNATGLALKIEKQEAKGAKRELGSAEFGKVAAATSAALATPASLAGTTNDPTAIVQAYYKGIADYLNAIAGLQ